MYNFKIVANKALIYLKMELKSIKRVKIDTRAKMKL